MLQSLEIRNFTIIEQLSLEFKEGFNVITGESGSGKSLVIKAIDSLRGQKLDPALLGNKKPTVITGTFSLRAGSKALAYLDTLGISYDVEDGKAELLLRRRIDQDNRSKAYINDQAVSLSTLKELTATFIDILGQNQGPLLLDEKNHTYLYDKLIDDGKTVGLVKSTFRANKELLDNLIQGIEEGQELFRSQDYRLFRFESLEQFRPSSDEYQELRTFLAEASKKNDAADLLAELNQYFNEDGEEASLFASARRVRKIADKLARLKPESFLPVLELANSLYANMEQLGYLASEKLSHYDFDSTAFEGKESRLARYQELFRQLGVDHIEGLIAKYDALKREMDALSGLYDTLSLLLIQLAGKSKELCESAQKLDNLRLLGQKKLASLCQNEFSDLDLKDCQIRFTLQANPAREKELHFEFLGAEEGTELKAKWQALTPILESHNEFGKSRVLFEVQTNPQQEFKSLAKIASGGERSRMSLALNKIFLEKSTVKTLILDEIDVGVSGKAAAKMGHKMQEMGHKTQLICISHLAQVASFADHHICIFKEKSQSRAQVYSKALGSEERAQELAKLLSGNEVTTLSLKNARSLLLENQPNT